MGKASKWIRTLLLGKKEENFKQIDTFCSEKKTANAVKSSSSSNKMVVKRKWSFRKLTGGRSTGRIVAHKVSKSFDSIDSSKLQIQALMFQTQTPRTTAEFVKRAATRIQASFCSYLARRALHALRGFVKLQALVRGHLLRKQTTTTLRGMHALMSIQVRARIKRIKMAEEENPLEIQPPQHIEIPHFKPHKTQQRQNQDSKNMSVEEMLGVMRSRSGPLDVKSRKQSWSSPNYMNKTESSKAKTRSSSEPRQRPKLGTKQNSSKSVEGGLLKQNMLSHSARYDHWVVNSMKESKRDSFDSCRVTTSDDSYYM
ncbi:unnamed protein product [Vicia faba]|uniref:DUF4005 domain-containing protein n=1 Tax=Vicia faba TaxID=3906 RepID=A0AAV1BBP5_VICFA|nr:unnamed protein product [Vicia faba]